MTLFAITRPFIPADHPMFDYANYVVDVTNGIYAMLWVTCFLLAALVLAFLVFAFQKYLDRKEDERRRKSMDDAVAALMGVVTILDTVKANMDRRLEHATEQIKTEVSKLPEPTAQKVVEKIGEQKLTDSGVIPRLPGDK